MEGESFLQNVIIFLNQKEPNNLESTLNGLSIFRSFIEYVHPKRISCLDWSEDFFDQFTEQIKMHQDLLISLNVIDLIVNNIKNQTQDQSIFEETLLLAIAVLYGGNRNAQQ